MVTFDIDAPSITRDEATELCVYHLQMAASYFEATPHDDNISLYEEIDRKIDTHETNQAAKAWAKLVLDYYESLERQYQHGT